MSTYNNKKMSLDEIFREYQPFKRKWELVIVSENEDGVLVMAPNGDTHYMSHEDYKSYKLKTENNDRSN